MGEAKNKQKHLKAVEQTVTQTQQPQVLTNLTPQELAFFQGLQQEKQRMRIVTDFFLDSIKFRLGELDASGERGLAGIRQKYALDGKNIVLNIETGEITLAPEPPAVDPEPEGGPDSE